MKESFHPAATTRPRACAPGSAIAAAAALVACLAAATGTAHGEPATAYGRLLARHVRPGVVSGMQVNVVDYATLSRDPDYAAALSDLAAADPASLATDEDRIAFWINAYNLLAIKAIVDRYPIASIRDGGTLLSPIWKKRIGAVGGREYSLDDVEHGILRAKFREPRIHFAVVCASLSCPDLRPEPYEGARLDAQLDDQTHTFLGNEQKGVLPGRSGKRARVSSIFKWFGRDFEAAGGVAQFMRAKAPPDVAAKLPELQNEGLTYLDYDWSLNDAARAAAP